MANSKMQIQTLKCIGFSFFVFYFTIVPNILRDNWDILRNLLLGNYIGDYFFYIAGMAIINFTIFTGGAIIFYFIYTLKIPFLEQFKIQSKPWKWEGQNQDDKKDWNQLLKKTILNNIFNLFGVGLLLVIYEVYAYGLELKFDKSQIPTNLHIFKEVMICWNIHEFFFYVAHRLLHHRYIYKYIHKIHHQYKQNITIAGQYFHPLEFICGIVLPGTMGRRLVGGVHFISLIMWIFILSLSAVEAHCGYHFPFTFFGWSDTIFVTAEYHEYHHSHNVGTFSAIFSYYDYIFGTNKEFLEYRNKKQIQEKIK